MYALEESYTNDTQLQANDTEPNLHTTKDSKYSSVLKILLRVVPRIKAIKITTV